MTNCCKNISKCTLSLSELIPQSTSLQTDDACTHTHAFMGTHLELHCSRGPRSIRSLLIDHCIFRFDFNGDLHSSAFSTDNALNLYQLGVASASSGLKVNLQINHWLTYCLFLSLSLHNKLPSNCFTTHRL